MTDEYALEYVQEPDLPIQQVLDFEDFDDDPDTGDPGEGVVLEDEDQEDDDE
jgi:hypothetical protein